MTQQNPLGLDASVLEKNAIDSINKIFKDHRVGAEAISCLAKGPLLRFAVTIKDDAKIKDLEAIEEEIGFKMKGTSDPLIYPSRVNGVRDGTMTLDLMIDKHPTVDFDELVKASGFANPKICEQYNIPILLGTTDVDVPLIIDLQKMPHCIISGVTGSGKSMLIHAINKSIEIHSATQGIRLALIDPKLVEFVAYEKSEALRYSIGHSANNAMDILEDLHETLQKRLALLAKRGCRDILEYRAAGGDMPFIVLVIDELADLMRAKTSGFAQSLCGLAAMSRAAGIHIVAATQHPSMQVITGLLKAQFPGRIACQVATQAHSRVVLDRHGAEKLLGAGDALLLDNVGDLRRFKGAFVNIPKIIKSQPTQGKAKKSTKKAKPHKNMGFLELLAKTIKSGR